MKMYMIWVFMHDVDLVNYMVKVLINIDEVVLSYYVDIWFGCNGLWPHDRFIKYVWGNGALHSNCTSVLNRGVWVMVFLRLWCYELLCMLVDIITWLSSFLDYVFNYVDMHVDLTRHSIVCLVLYMVFTYVICAYWLALVHEYE